MLYVMFLHTSPIENILITKISNNHYESLMQAKLFQPDFIDFLKQMYLWEGTM